MMSFFKFIEKYKINENIIFETSYWSWILKTKQSTLGSSFLILKRDCTSFNELLIDELSDFKFISSLIERVFAKALNIKKVQFLKLMMVDDQLHFHIVPRHGKQINLFNHEWNDSDWPGLPKLESLNYDSSIDKKVLAYIKSFINKETLLIGYTTGVFDLFHVGHLNVLKNASEKCDFLIVGVSTDELVMQYKLKKPVIPYIERFKIIESLKFVNKVVPQFNKNKYEAWKSIRFNRIFVGSDWKGTPDWLKVEKDFQNTDVDVIYLPHTDGVSSTLLTEFLKRNK